MRHHSLPFLAALGIARVTVRWHLMAARATLARLLAEDPR